MFKKYSSKPFNSSKKLSFVKKIRNRSSSRVSSLLPEEESLLHEAVNKSSQKYRYKCNIKKSGSNRVKVEPEPNIELKSELIDSDMSSDPGIKELQEYYKISQDLSRLQVQVEKISEMVNIFRDSGVLNRDNINNSGDRDELDEILLI